MGRQYVTDAMQQAEGTTHHREAICSTHGNEAAGVSSTEMEPNIRSCGNSQGGLTAHAPMGRHIYLDATQQAEC
jgi:hypothetical protein